MDAKSFGAFIADQRRTLGLTQAEVAARLHVTDKAVSRWERGEVTPGIDMMKLIAAVTGEQLSHLLEMPEHYCESCGMYLTPDDCGTDARGKKTDHYCKWCYADGTYTYSNMDELIDVCVTHMVKEDFTEAQARAYMQELLPTLDYWKKYESLSDNGLYKKR